MEFPALLLVALAMTNTPMVMVTAMGTVMPMVRPTSMLTDSKVMEMLGMAMVRDMPTSAMLHIEK